MTRAFAILILIAVACIGSGARGTQLPSFSYAIVVETPTRLEEALRRLTREGQTCAAVARPAGTQLSTNVAVISSRPGGAASGSSTAAEVAVVTATAGSVDELEQRLNAAAAQGFNLCGITMTAAIWGQPSAYALVAILTRTSAAPAGTSYRVVRSRGRREDWTQLERAAAEGFAVSRLVSRPEPGTSNTSDIVFVAEKSAASRPLRYELAFAGNGPALQKEIEKSSQRGHCVQAAWATSERMSVLLAKPSDAACDQSRAYEVEESSRFAVNSADGALLGMFRIKDGAMALYNGRDLSREYSVIEDALPDAGVRSVFAPREHRLLTEKLDVDGRRGFWPLDVTWRSAGSRGMRAIDIIMFRQRQ